MNFPVEPAGTEKVIFGRTIEVIGPHSDGSGGNRRKMEVQFGMSQKAFSLVSGVMRDILRKVMVESANA
jgi:hypothetical protein